MCSKLGLTGASLLFVLATLTACGGGGSTEPPASSVTVIGPAGGTATGPDGVQVVVPPGALDQPTRIGIARSSAGAPTTLPEDITPAGSIYEFTPHDVTFNVPVIIRMPVPANTAGAEALMASPGGDWQVQAATVTGKVAEWQRNSFSWGLYGWACAPTNRAPYSNSNPDPYPCWPGPSGGTDASATPALAITRTAYAWPSSYSGTAGSWTVNQASTVHLTVRYAAVPDCENARVKLLRWNPAVPLDTPGRVQTLFDQPVTITPTTFPMPGGIGTYVQAVGSTTRDVTFSHLDNGTIAFGYSFSCNRPFRTARTGGDVSTFVVSVPVPTVLYTVGGVVSGLAGTGLVLRNNGGDNTSIATDGSFTFATSIGAGSPYNVTVLTQPTGQTCTVANGSGTANANVSTVNVSCVTGAAWQGAALIETGDGDLPVVPRIAMDPDGNAFAIWVQNGGGFFPDIWTNRYVEGGGWETPALMETSDTNVGIPGIAMQANGNAMAVWPQTDGIRDSIWASRYVVGSGWSTPLLIETDNAGHAAAPSIAIDATGNAIAVWHQFDGVRNNIWANRYVAGIGWGAATLIETDNAQSAVSPIIAMDANGNAIAVWNQFDGTRNNNWANRYVASSGWGTATLIETDNAGSAVSPSIAMDANGNAIAVWAQSDGTRYNVWANRYVAGTGWGVAALIENDNTGDVFQGSPVVMDANGNAMVAWSQFDGTRSNVWANRYIAGPGWGTATLIETDNAGATGSPSIAMNASGNAIAVWHQSDGTRTNIWANRYVAGTGWGTAALIETDDTGDAIYPSVVMATSGNAIAMWLQWDGVRNNVWANVFR